MHKYFRFLIIFLISILAIGCKQHSTLSQQVKNREKSEGFESSNTLQVNQDKSDLEKITYLRKVGEIRDGFCVDKYNYFVKISSICVDAQNNLYLADSGLHRIFKFNSQGEYISSFGSEGQGPGEFVGTLRISVGNDNKLYVTDDGNWRLLIFTLQGEFIRQFPLPRFIYDRALANSKGEIYLLSPSGLKVIDLYDSNMKLKESLLEMKYHLDFLYEHPSRKIINFMAIRPSINEIKKILTKDDHFFVVFNNSQIVIHLDQNNKIVNQFRIKHPRFVNDYKIRLKAVTSKGGWMRCFGSIFFDRGENICLSYYNASLELQEVYRYIKNGDFIDTLRIESKQKIINELMSECDDKGNFYSISTDATKIIIYRIAN